MAKQSQVDLLRSNVQKWNHFRDQTEDHEIDLAGADLSDTNLVGAKLSDLELSQTNFRGASLGGAQFKHAHLKHADFTAADGARANFELIVCEEAQDC